MRIALCLSGYFRGLEACLPTWQRNLLDPDHQWDCFIATGPTIEWCSKNSIFHLVELIKPHFDNVGINILEPVELDSPTVKTRNFNKRNIEHVSSMFHKIHKANQMKSQYEYDHRFTYDLVIRWRPDIYLRSQVDLGNEPDKLYVPKHGDFGGLNDQAAWSSSKNMNHYSSLFNNIVSYMEEDQRLDFNPEHLTKRNWEKLGCPLMRPNILYQLARDNTNMLPDNETRERIQRESNGRRNV